MSEEKESNKSELFTGLLIAVFAAILAITDLGGGRFGGDEMLADNEETKMYNWYQSKSIKSSLYKGQVELMQALEQSHAIKAEYKDALDNHINKLNNKISRYEKEMNEIKKGSAAVGKENWAQDINGELGKVIGADEWEATAAKLGEAGDQFDMATLFLQVCLVFGAISLVIQAESTKKIFLYLMIFLGLIGTAFSIVAYMTAFSA